MTDFDEAEEKWQLGREQRSVRGLKSLHGTVGAPGPLANDGDQLDLLLTDASSTPESGSKTYQGLLRVILSQWRGPDSAEFTVMASFDSETGRRLRDALSGEAGSSAMDDALCSLTITIAQRPST